ncbi:hypothetical protein CAB17_03440 [Legionella sainthelensi]|uniref:Uncharacterized protein n=1 Tax=Legionella sainthelensi TaxID=28087 RepID=A0A2H5FI39_9GAMM|nr:hypothetical protein CAB17_03440 [Legionella sainthelensi]
MNKDHMPTHYSQLMIILSLIYCNKNPRITLNLKPQPWYVNNENIVFGILLLLPIWSWGAHLVINAL